MPPSLELIARHPRWFDEAANTFEAAMTPGALTAANWRCRTVIKTPRKIHEIF
jgi:hypothetical protein